MELTYVRCYSKRGDGVIAGGLFLLLSLFQLTDVELTSTHIMKFSFKLIPQVMAPTRGNIKKKLC